MLGGTGGRVGGVQIGGTGDLRCRNRARRLLGQRWLVTKFSSLFNLFLEPVGIFEGLDNVTESEIGKRLHDIGELGLRDKLHLLNPSTEFAAEDLFPHDRS
jgi:hypothetical protein